MLSAFSVLEKEAMGLKFGGMKGGENSRGLERYEGPSQTQLLDHSNQLGFYLTSMENFCMNLFSRMTWSSW